MKKLSLVGLLLCLFAAAGAAGQDIRRPAVAGVFYEKDPGRLAASLKRLLDAVDPRPIEGEVLALVAPHAAYACSGPTAARAYRQVGDSRYDAVVIIGPSHYVGFEGCSIYPRGGYETPLGVAAVDAALAAELGRRTGFGFTPEAHAREHSVEVQVPFLQTVLPGVPIVPVVMGFADRRTVRTLAEGLTAARAGRKILVVASTDLSHHLPRGRAGQVDAETVGLIKAGNVEALFRKYERQDNVFCGGGAVLAALLYARKAGGARVEVLGYADSSETCGPEDAVVGYVSAAFVSAPSAPGGAWGPLPSLSREERRELLGAARLALEAAVRKSPWPDIRSSSPALNAPGAAFVTLTESRALRGCMGFIEASGPLLQSVARAAVLAAFEDPRFEPVTIRELRSLRVEVSVLSPLVRIADPKHVRVGRHGLVVGRGERRGLLLPRVATDNGWGREEFLRQACLKAGLPADDWQEGAEVYVFETLVIR